MAKLKWTLSTHGFSVWWSSEPPATESALLSLGKAFFFERANTVTPATTNALLRYPGEREQVCRTTTYRWVAFGSFSGARSSLKGVLARVENRACLIGTSRLPGGFSWYNWRAK